MILEQYGVTLKRVEYEDIEIIRNWRNQTGVKNNMLYKKHITKKMQEKWFDSINNKYNYYFLIQYKGKNYGVINAKNINFEDAYGEGGVFIGEECEELPFLSVFASLCLLNAVFTKIDLFNKSFAQVLNSNKKAITFNKKLGYCLIPGQQNQQASYYVLTKEDYIKKAQQLNNFAQKYTNDYVGVRIKGKASELNCLAINQLFRQVSDEL